MIRRCLNCMKEFQVPIGSEKTDAVCPHCGFLENTKPKVINHLYPGMVLRDRYIIGTVIGSGGFGIIYKAWDPNLSAIVAIKEHYPTLLVQRTPGTKKVMLSDSDKKNEFIEGKARFLEEARNMAKFDDHPNIVHVFSYFEENNTAYFVMEYLDGPSMKDYLKANKRIKPDEVEKYFLPVMNALKSIHKEKILHRDISPDNIILCRDGKIKLLDFGAARFSDDEKELTRSIVLKPGYAPPEQYQSKSVQGAFTDVYALGATIYHALTGVRPEESLDRVNEEGKENKKQKTKTNNFNLNDSEGVFKKPIELNPEIPKWLNNIIMKAMALKPELRFKSIEEFEKFLTEKRDPGDTETVIRIRKILRAVGIAAIIIALAIGTIVAWKMYTNKKLEPVKGTVTIWLPYSSESSEEEAKTMVQNMVSSFLETYAEKNITVTIEAIPEEEYIDRLDQVKGTDKMPDLFVSYSDGRMDEILKSAVDMEEVFKLISKDETEFLEDYKKDIQNSKCFPIGYEVASVYVRRNDNVDMADVTVKSVEDFNINGSPSYYSDADQNELNLKTLNVQELNSSYGTDADAMEAFKNGNLIYYLASTDEFRLFSTEMAGLFEMRPYDTENVYGYFTDFWSVSSKSSRAETLDAEFILSYFLSQAAQNEYHITNKHSIPLNKDSYNDFVGVNSKYNIVTDYKNKLKLLYK